jgi:cold shock CspA family protein
VQVALDQGYGFVDLGDDEEVHFLRQAVAGGSFEELVEGMAVEVDVMETPAGYQATRIVPLHPGQPV